MIPPGPVPAIRPDPVPARREPAGPVPAEVLPPEPDSVPAGRAWPNSTGLAQREPARRWAARCGRGDQVGGGPSKGIASPLN
jgi:hypothetical protein